MNKLKATPGPRFSREKKASIRMLGAGLLGGMLAVAAAGLAASSWQSSAISLQRTAIAAANAGAVVYGTSGDARTAATAAAQVAQLNGVAGGAMLVWDAGTKTLTGGRLTVQVLGGPENAAGATLTVSAFQTRTVLAAILPGSMTRVTRFASAPGVRVAGYAASGEALTARSSGG